MMEIRVANPNDAVSIGRIHVETWRSTYEGIIPSDFLESLSYEQRADFWRDLISDPDATGFIYVADHAEDGVVGFASGGPIRDDNPDYEGELFAIYVIEDYQHEGIGHQLFVKAIVIHHLHPGKIPEECVQNPLYRLRLLLGIDRIS